MRKSNTEFVLINLKTFGPSSFIIIKHKIRANLEPTNFRLCGSSVGNNNRQFISETNEMYGIFRSMFPANDYVNGMFEYPLLGFRARVSAGKIYY